VMQFSAKALSPPRSNNIWGILERV